jgi:hypothetical protein
MPELSIRHGLTIIRNSKMSSFWPEFVKSRDLVYQQTCFCTNALVLSQMDPHHFFKHELFFVCDYHPCFNKNPSMCLLITWFSFFKLTRVRIEIEDTFTTRMIMPAMTIVIVSIWGPSKSIIFCISRRICYFQNLIFLQNL